MTAAALMRIPLIDMRSSVRAPIPPLVPYVQGALVDTRHRTLRDLRISVTDRCNFRCTYCMPKEVFGDDYAFLPHDEVLTFEEIVHIAKIFHGHGVEKIRLTGGEPLLRKDIELLVEKLARELPGVVLTLTTNGSALKAKAKLLRMAGLTRISVSLDSLDDTTFRAMNNVEFPVGKVLDAIDAAAAAGFAPIKINMVVKRGVNDKDIVEMARHFKNSGNIVRFIEFMDVGASNGWKMDDVVSSAEVIRRIDQVFPCEPVNPNYSGEVAKRWRYKDGSGEFGVISSVTEAFCDTCTRARLSTDGAVYTCLFAQKGYDLKAMLRGGKSDDEIHNAIASIWQHRVDRYSEIRTSETARQKKVEMSFIGG
ncbi:cyclic pyranopterin monophosphate synthase [mine drainage metagenome]|uniref:GTP 3',8-cyclase n=1 Tax=mine drainage metagenome TaxID=410659 RepID=A0A1J5S2P8_9ZZZZ